MANKNLNAAKTAKKDEFYTQLVDIERELQHYWLHFRDKRRRETNYQLLLRLAVPFLPVFAKQSEKTCFKKQLFFYNKVVFARK